jgi:flavin-dependent dehydrogenase
MWDAIIVGSRVAGASLGMLLARAGRRVLLLDRASFPSDTMSTHFLWPRTSGFLKTWDLLEQLEATGCPPIRRMRVTMDGLEYSGAPSAVRGAESMYCPKRTILDALLVDAAREAGAEVREGVTAREVIWSERRVTGVIVEDGRGNRNELSARIVVGADGLNSRVARAVSAPFKFYEPPLTFAFYAYWDGVPLDHFGSHRAAGCRVLEFATHNGQTCIYVGWPMQRWEQLKSNIQRSYLDAIDAAWGLRDRAAQGRRASRLNGSSKLPNYYRQSTGPGWALVGDAAHHLDPTTGMGIGNAFLGAELLARAIHAALYEISTDRFDRAMSEYEGQFYSQTSHIWDWTIRAGANFKQNAGMIDFFRGVLTNARDTTRMFDVFAGSQPMETLFTPELIARYSTLGRQVKLAAGERGALGGFAGGPRVIV